MEQCWGGGIKSNFKVGNEGILLQNCLGSGKFGINIKSGCQWPS